MSEPSFSYDQEEVDAYRQWRRTTGVTGALRLKLRLLVRLIKDRIR